MIGYADQLPDALGEHFRYYVTNISHSIVVLEALLDGEPLVNGDEIGVFTEIGFGAGAEIIQQVEGEEVFPVGVAAWGDDPEIERVIGFVDGETIEFRYWDNRVGEEWVAEAEYVQGDEVYTPDGFSIVRLSVSTGRRPVIELSENAHRWPKASPPNTSSN